MNVAVSDLETIGETSTQAFQLYQQGPVSALVQLQNVGVNDIVYKFQAYVAGVWTDLGALGTDFNGTLEASAKLALQITTSSAQVRMLAAASGGSTLFFSVLQPMSRTSGGALPLINF